MKPFNEGKQAFRKGLLGNPYQDGTQRHRDWEYGFSKEYFSNLNRQKKYEENYSNKEGPIKGST